MSEKKPICGVLAGEPEIIGERCADGGKCHHRCTDTCLRRSTCAPLSGSGLRFDWSVPALRADADLAGDRFEVPVSGWSGPAHDEREAFNAEYDRICNRPLTMREIAWRMCQARANRPAQTEQQPVATWMGTDWNAQQQLIAHLCKLEPGTDLYAAPVAQTEQQPVAWRDEAGNLYPSRESLAKYLPEGRNAAPLYAAPIAQTAKRGDA